MLKYTKQLFLYIVSMRLITHVLKLKLPVFVFKVPNYSSSTTAFLKIWTVTQVKENCFTLSVFKETTAHAPANTAASRCSLPRNQAATAFYKMFVVFNHAPHPFSFNEQNWNVMNIVTWNNYTERKICFIAVAQKYTRKMTFMS